MPGVYTCERDYCRGASAAYHVGGAAAGLQIIGQGRAALVEDDICIHRYTCYCLSTYVTSPAHYMETFQYLMAITLTVLTMTSNKH